MANQSILAAFERMWQHIIAALKNKADVDHSHTIDDIDGYVPGGGGSSVQSDWNVNDENAPEYIKNRPFYEGNDEDAEITILPETNIIVNTAGYMTLVSTTYPLMFEEGRTYKVTFDGVQYECVAWVDSYASDNLKVCIGSREIYNGRTDEDVPFCFCAWVNKNYTGYLMTDVQGTYTVSITTMVTMPSEVYQLDEKYIPDAVKSDWDQNDENALNYIKNKPFYTITNIPMPVFELQTQEDKWSYIGRILNDDGAIYCYNFYEYDGSSEYYPIIDEFTLELGKEYTVTFTGVDINGVNHTDSYTVTCIKSPNGSEEGYMLGERLVNTQTAVVCKYPFWLTQSFVYFRFLANDERCNYIPTSVALMSNDGERVVQIDPKYIPSASNNNWEDINNKPFYEETDIVNIIPETTIEGFSLMEDSIYYVFDPFTFDPVNGKIYTVTWDGVNYDVEFVRFNNQFGFMGNENYANMVTGGDIPFAIVFSYGSIYLVTESTSNSHSISINGEGNIIHYLDHKYIKDMYYDNVEITELVPETTINFFESYARYVPNSYIEFEEGKTYIVVYNGTQYECTAWRDEYRGVVIGNGKFLWSEGYGDDVPFAFESRYTMIYYSDVGFNTFSIYGDSLDNVLLPETTLSCYSGASLRSSAKFEEGKTYIVIFDGVQYECIAWMHPYTNYGHRFVIGNGEFVDAEGYGNDAPFAFIYDSTIPYERNEMSSAYAGLHTFSVYDESLNDVLIPETRKAIGFGWGECSSFEIIEGDTYAITLDGIQYECMAWDTEWRGLAIGNGDIMYDMHKSGDNVPFYLDLADGTCWILTYMGDHTISIDKIKHEFRKIDKKYLPDIQGDWNQTDETSINYIKNKPFGETSIVDYTNTIIDNTTFTIDEEMYTQISDNLYFIPGKKYKVIFNGKTYYCVAWNDEDEVVYVGNGNIYGGSGLGEDVPFSFDSYPDNVCYLNTMETGDYTISIISGVNQIKKIDKKYLPDDLVATQADWNQSDETANDYIKNKPFGEVKALDVIIPETTVEGFSLMQNSIYAVQNPFSFNPTLGDVYTVIWDGVEYDVEVKTADNMGYMGNVNYVNMTTGGDIPFAIIFSMGNIYLATESTANSHAISICISTEEIKKIDKKYLPDDLTPFGENPNAKVLLDITLNTNDWHFYGWKHYWYNYTNDCEPHTFTLGKTYTVKLDDKSYTLKCYQDEDGSPIIGRTPYKWQHTVPEHNFDYQFFVAPGHIGYQINDLYSELEGQLPSHIVIIEEEFTTIDPKFIPEDNKVGLKAEGKVYEINGQEYVGGANAEIFNNYAHNKAIGIYSHAEGFDTTAAGNFQHVQGLKNIPDFDNKYIHIVGNGNIESTFGYSNAHTLDWNGNAWYAGDIRVGGTSYDDASEVALKSDIPTEYTHFILIDSVTGNKYKLEMRNGSLTSSLIEPEKTLISFSVEWEDYQAEEGMTWAEWVVSDYNTDGYTVDEDSCISKSNGDTIAKGFVVVRPSDIINNTSYGIIGSGEQEDQ